MISNSDMPFNLNDGHFDNDWVIIKLDSPFEMNSDVQAACLPSSTAYLSTSSTEDRCFSSGWGWTSLGLQYYF